MSLAAIEARARARAGAGDPRARAKRFNVAEQARRIANLKAEGYVIPLSEWIGHNNGPDWDEVALFIAYCWKEAHKKVCPYSHATRGNVDVAFDVIGS